MTTRHRDPWTLALGLGALGNLANGAWMLVDPSSWYRLVPGVTGSGPLNEHFVRDIGSTFAVLGLALAGGAVRPDLRFPLLALVAAFYDLHAAVHVLDTLRGLFPPGQWAIDALPVYLPCVLLTALAALAWRSR